MYDMSLYITRVPKIWAKPGPRSIFWPSFKNVLYGRNAVGESFLIGIMNNIKFPELQEDNNRNAPHSSAANGYISLTK